MIGLIFVAMAVVTAVLCVRDGASIAETIIWSGLFIGFGGFYLLVKNMGETNR